MIPHFRRFSRYYLNFLLRRLALVAQSDHHRTEREDMAGHEREDMAGQIQAWGMANRIDSASFRAGRLLAGIVPDSAPLAKPR